MDDNETYAITLRCPYWNYSMDITELTWDQAKEIVDAWIPGRFVGEIIPANTEATSGLSPEVSTPAYPWQAKWEDGI